MATSKPTLRAHQIREVKPSLVDSQTQIQALAYQLWLERGAPIGSPNQDWLEAEARLSHIREEKATTAR
jgi:hypothetical protein